MYLVHLDHWLSMKALACYNLYADEPWLRTFEVVQRIHPTLKPISRKFITRELELMQLSDNAGVLERSNHEKLERQYLENKAKERPLAIVCELFINQKQVCG